MLKKQLSSSFTVLIHLRVSTAKIIYVFNKMDLVNPEDAKDKYGKLGILNQSNKNAVMISSKSGTNLDILLKTILSKIYVSMMKADS